MSNNERRDVTAASASRGGRGATSVRNAGGERTWRAWPALYENDSVDQKTTAVVGAVSKLPDCF